MYLSTRERPYPTCTRTYLGTYLGGVHSRHGRPVGRDGRGPCLGAGRVPGFVLYVVCVVCFW